MQTQNRLKIALQKKGRLSQDCAAYSNNVE